MEDLGADGAEQAAWVFLLKCLATKNQVIFTCILIKGKKMVSFTTWVICTPWFLKNKRYQPPFRALYSGCNYQVIIKITVSSIVIGLKMSYFPVIHLPSCYRTACYRAVCYRTVQQTNQIQSCCLNQPITTLVSITVETVYKLLNLCILCQFFNVKFPCVT